MHLSNTFSQVTHEGLTGKILIKNGLRQTVNMVILHLDQSGKIEQLGPGFAAVKNPILLPGQFSQIGEWSKHGNEVHANLTMPSKKAANSALKTSSPLIVKTRLVMMIHK